MEFINLSWKRTYWLNDFKVPNGVHVYGRRYNPFGPQTIPKLRRHENTPLFATRQFGQHLRERSLILAQLTQRPLNFLMYQLTILPPTKTVRTETSNTHQVYKRRQRSKFLRATKSNFSRMRTLFLTLPTQYNSPSITKEDSGWQLWQVCRTWHGVA